MNIFEYYNEIKRSSLFVYIPQKFHELLLENSTIEIIDAGSPIKPDNHLYIFLEGEAKILKKGTEILIENMKPGRSIELVRFLDNQEWQHDWVTIRKSTFLKVDPTTLRKIFDQMPQTFQYLLNISRFPNLHRLKRDLKLAGVEKKVINHLFLNVSESVRIDPSKTNQLTIAIIQQGHVKAFLPSDDKDVLIHTFLESDYLFLKKDMNVKLETSPNFICLRVRCSDVLLSALRDALPILDRLQSEYERIEKELINQKEIEEDDIVEEDDNDFEVSDFKPSPAELEKSHKKKYFWFRQHDMMDCGAACLSMISYFYGRKINVPTWRSLVHITREGASMLSLKKAAERVGFDSIGVMTGYKALQSLQMPCIALLQYHYVVLYKVDDTGVWIADPGSQLKFVKKDDFIKEFSSNCLLLKKNKKLDQFPESKNSFLKYFELFKDAHLRIGEIMAISLIILLFGLAEPLFMQFVFDNVLGTMDEIYLRVVALSFIAILAITSFAEKIRGNLISSLTSKLTAKFNSLFLLQTLKLPLSYFEVRNVGDITTRIEELGKIRDFFSTKFVVTFLNLSAFFLYAGVLALYDYRLLLILVPFLPILLLLLRYLMKQAIENLNETFKVAGKNQSIVFEHISGIKTLKSISGIMAARWKWEETLVNLLKKRKEFEHIAIILNASGSFFQEFIRYSLFMGGVYLYLIDQLSLGQVLAVHALGGSIVTPLIELLQEWDEFNKITVSMEKVDEIFTSKTEKIDFLKSTEKKSKALRGDIHFENIFFQYGNEYSPMVLKGVDLTIPQGKMVAFVGSSGSGKTTLAYMVNLLYTPKKGKVTIGQVDTSQMKLEDLRESIAMINQDNQLFSGTFLDNITLGDPAPDYKRAVKAAEMASAHEFIMQKKGGYYFNLGESGGGISGGQKQRINIARALYKNPDILIMDEATSALDAKSEEIILKNIKKRERRTTIIIAHRLNTITHADQIFVFHKSRLVEQGTHKDLLLKQGRYFHMFKKQLELS
jgi:subfamily B ATP-binding cassette protein HlyB/CyaB